MEMLSSQLIGLLAQTKEADPGMARVSVFVEGVNRLRPDLTIKWLVGSELPADAGPLLGVLQLQDVTGQIALESCPESFGESEIGGLKSAVQVLGMLAGEGRPSEPHPHAEMPRVQKSCRQVCKQITDYLAVTDSLGRVLECNEMFARQLNLKVEQVQGRLLRDVLLDGGERELLSAAASDVHASGKSFRGDFDFRSPRGAIVVDYVLTPVADESGHMYGTMMTGRDVTDCRRREQGLHDRIGHAEAASKARDEFLSLLSHELRTPLTPIVAGIEAMRQSLPQSAQITSDLTVIEQNVQTEVRLIDDLLDLARISRGGLSLRLETLDAQQIIEEAVAACAAEISSKRIDLRRELGATSTLIRADPGRLKQVFWHLLRNALKFTPIGGSVTIQTSNDQSLSDAAPTLVCKVIDTGLGIDRTRLPKLFDGVEALGQARSGGGLGVGLMIARSVVRLHGGSLEAFSEGRGKGATFTVKVQTTQLQARPADESPRRRVSKCLRILLVEDHSDTARILAKLLDAMGHRTTIAGTVEEAKKAGEDGEFELLISDIGLPDGSGHELQTLMEKYPHMKGIAVSGYGSEEDIRKSIQAGFAVHLTKPVDLHVLRRHIQGIAETV